MLLTGVFLLTRENARYTIYRACPILRPLLDIRVRTIHWQCSRSITIFPDRDHPFKFDTRCVDPVTRGNLDPTPESTVSACGWPSHSTLPTTRLRSGSNRPQFVHAAQRFPRGTSRPLVNRPFINLSVSCLLLYVQRLFLHICSSALITFLCQTLTLRLRHLVFYTSIIYYFVTFAG